MEKPLISCIMITYDRPAMAEFATERFLRQDYPNKELIVVSDGEPPRIEHPSIRHIHLTSKTNMGKKRQIATGEAKGTIIAHWDDDDWYASNRLTTQAEPILSGLFSITFIEPRVVLFLPGDWRRFVRGPYLQSKMAYADCTMMYDHVLLREYNLYEDLDIVESIGSLDKIAESEPLEIVDNDGLFVYVRHSRCVLNWNKDDHRMFSKQAPPDWFDEADLKRYQEAINAK
jgi:glycosyltransferase involved in cell wall biosynthesis